MNKNENSQLLLDGLKLKVKDMSPSQVAMEKIFLLNSLQNAEIYEHLKEFKPPIKNTIIDNAEITLNLTKDCYVGITIPLLPSGLPTNLQTDVPISIFGLTDYLGGYYTSINFITFTERLTSIPKPYWVIKGNGIYGFNFSPQVAPSSLDYGDFTRQFYGLDSALAAFYTTTFVLSSSNNIGYGTIMNNLSDMKFILKSLKIVVDKANVNMFDNPLMFSHQKMNGQLKTDTVNLRTHIKPGDFQTMIVDVPLNVLFDKNLIINHYIKYNCTKVDYTFKLSRIK